MKKTSKTTLPDGTILRGFKYRIYPTATQQEFLKHQFGACRWVWNYFLEKRQKDYQETQKSSSYITDGRILTQLKQKEEYKWLREITVEPLQQSLKDLDTAYTNFFEKRADLPTFKSKFDKQSFRLCRDTTYIDDKGFRLPNLKSRIKTEKHRPSGEPRSYTISKTSSGKYYVSVLCRVDKPQPLLKTDKQIGIDLGIKDFLIDSNSNKVENPKFYHKMEKKLQYQQRQHSKKKKGSKNRNKQRIKVARTHEKIANSRANFLHQLSAKITNENQVIVVENLKISNMIKNRKLSKSISDCGWGEFVRQLKYKSEWKGRTFHQIDTWFASSKTCHICKFKLEKLELSVREWDCPNCHTHLDRDINAAINILNKGPSEIASLKSKSGSGIDSDSKQKLVEALSSASSSEITSCKVKKKSGKMSQRNKKSQTDKSLR